MSSFSTTQHGCYAEFHVERVRQSVTREVVFLRGASRVPFPLSEMWTGDRVDNDDGAIKSASNFIFITCRTNHTDVRSNFVR